MHLPTGHLLLNGLLEFKNEYLRLVKMSPCDLNRSSLPKKHNTSTAEEHTSLVLLYINPCKE